VLTDLLSAEKNSSSLCISSLDPSPGAESGREARRREAIEFEAGTREVNGFEAGKGGVNGCPAGTPEARRREAIEFEAGRREANGCAAGVRAGGRGGSEEEGNVRDRAEPLPSPPRSRTTDSFQASAELPLFVILLRLYIYIYVLWFEGCCVCSKLERN